MSRKVVGMRVTPRFGIWLAVIAALLMVPALGNRNVVLVGITFFFYAYLNLSWNLVGGYAGQLSMAHHAFIGVGAYTSTILFLYWGLTPWAGMFAGAFVAAILGLLISVLTFRWGIKGFYFALVTLAFAEVCRYVALSLGITKGMLGILIPMRNAPFQFQFLSRVPYYYIAFGLMIVGILITHWIERTKLGYYFVAIREDEAAAEAVGINSFLYKTVAMTMSAALAAIGGTFFAQLLLYVHPDVSLSLQSLINIVLGTLLGGMGTVWGPIVGALAFTALSELTDLIPITTQKAAALSMLLYGVILIGVVMFLPNGLLSLGQRLAGLRPSVAGISAMRSWFRGLKERIHQP